MKKSLRKLSLHRETLHSLEEGAIQVVMGGVSMKTCGSPCSAACSVDPCYAPSDRCTAFPCTK